MVARCGAVASATIAGLLPGATIGIVRDSEKGLMIREPSPSSPKLQALDRAGCERIHHAALAILAGTGTAFLHDEARATLCAAGGRLAEDGRSVRLPSALVERAVASAPSTIDVFDRNGALAMRLGERQSYFGPGSDLLFTVDGGYDAPSAAEHRRSVLDDVRRAARVADALDEIDFVMSSANPSDVPPRAAYLHSFRAMVEHTTKPLVCTAESDLDLEAMWRIAVAVRGSATALRERPYFVHYAEPLSPLRHTPEAVRKLLFCADQAVPLVYSPAPMAGSTAPMTIAGHVAQGVAECLAGLVLHQLRAAGAPFLFGMGPAILDMRTAECSYSAPEYFLAYLAVQQMSQHYELPSWGYAGTSDAQLPDEQASFEAGLQTALSLMVGANLNHDVGYLNFGKTGSLEMLAIGDEQIGMLRRLMRGIALDDEQLAVEVVDQAYRNQGKFLAHPHTRKHVRTTQWRPWLSNRLDHGAWRRAGSSTLRERAHRRVQTILADHRPPPLPNGIGAAIDGIVADCVERLAKPKASG